MGCGCNKNKGGNDKTPKASKANKNIRGTQILNAFKQKQFEDKAIVEKMRNQSKSTTPENVPARFCGIHREKMQAAKKGNVKQYQDVLKREQAMKYPGRAKRSEESKLRHQEKQERKTQKLIEYRKLNP